MSAPRFAPCKCKHPKVDHDALAPQCSAAGCECLRYRPDVPTGTQAGATRPATPSPVAAVAPAAATVNTGPTVEQILAAGKRSSSKRLNALADKITAQLEDLRAKLHVERRAADEKRKQDERRQAALAEVQRLERELAAARARAKGGPPPAAKSTPAPIAAGGSNSCSRPDCDRTFVSSQARAMHERRAHDGFDPKAAKAG